MQFKVFDLSLIDFKKAGDFQRRTFESVKNEDSPGALVFCRHNPVITLGRASDLKNILINEEELNSRKIPLFKAERGGDVTYHGPGQLMAYPIFNLKYLKKDIHFFLRNLEQTVIDLLADFGVRGERTQDLTGVWVEEKKISSIGIAVSHWITFHGLSLNVKENDLGNFALIRPCGLDVKMTSIESELGKTVDFETVKENLTGKFKEVF